MAERVTTSAVLAARGRAENPDLTARALLRTLGAEDHGEVVPMTYEPVTLEHLLAHQSWAIQIARRLVRGEGEAEELVQRTWLAALRRPPAAERGARAWIRTVIQNLARERHRRDSTRERHERASLDAPRLEPGALESV